MLEYEINLINQALHEIEQKLIRSKKLETTQSTIRLEAIKEQMFVLLEMVENY